MVDMDILEKTLEFTPRNWILSSYIATDMDNVAIIFIKADDAENEIEKYLRDNIEKEENTMPYHIY